MKRKQCSLFEELEHEDVREKYVVITYVCLNCKKLIKILKTITFHNNQEILFDPGTKLSFAYFDEYCEAIKYIEKFKG